MEPSVICKKINTTHGKTDDMESSYVSWFKCLNIVKSFEIPTNIFFGTQLSSFRCFEDFSDLLNFFFWTLWQSFWIACLFTIKSSVCVFWYYSYLIIKCFWSFKMLKAWGRRDGLAVKKTYCFCREPELSSQHLCQVLHNHL